ncbi:MAG: serine/threonine-protein kinase [Synechococcales bacterium]|nr:serine/threonine-protein kinase [Synechococcales bacterium]
MDGKGGAIMQTPIAGGTLLQNRYYLLRMGRLTEFGWLYSAVDQQQQGRLCLLEEFIPPWRSAEDLERVRQAFENEIKAIARVQHPQIPHYHLPIADRGRLFLPQVYHEGKSYQQFLEERIFQGRRFSATETFTTWEQLLTTLVTLHAQGLIHGNLTLESLVTPAWHQPPLLMHLGQIRQLALELGFQPCTPLTVPPPIAPPLQPTATTDLQAIAQIILQLLTGQALTNLYDRARRSWIWQRDSLPSAAADLLDALLYLPPTTPLSAADVLQVLRGEAALLLPLLPPDHGSIHSSIDSAIPPLNADWQIDRPGNLPKSALSDAIALDPIALPSHSASRQVFATLTQQTKQIHRPKLPTFPFSPTSSLPHHHQNHSTSQPAPEASRSQAPAEGSKPHEGSTSFPAAFSAANSDRFPHDLHPHDQPTPDRPSIAENMSSTRRQLSPRQHPRRQNPRKQNRWWQDVSFLAIVCLLLLLSGLGLSRLRRSLRPAMPEISFPDSSSPIVDTQNPSENSPETLPSLSNVESSADRSTTALSQQLQTKLQTLNIPTPVFLGAVDELTQVRPTAEASSDLAEQWDKNAVILMEKLETLDLQSRQGMGSYRRTSYDRWLANAQAAILPLETTPELPTTSKTQTQTSQNKISQTRLSAAVANWITDQRFFTWFPAHQNRQLNPRQLGQVWYAIAQQQLAKLPTHTITLSGEAKPFEQATQLTDTDFKLYRVPGQAGQTLKVEFQPSHGNSQFTVLQGDRLLIKNSKNQPWQTTVNQTSIYDIIIAGDRNAQFQIKIKF